MFARLRCGSRRYTRPVPLCWPWKRSAATEIIFWCFVQVVIIIIFYHYIVVFVDVWRGALVNRGGVCAEGVEPRIIHMGNRVRKR